MRQPPLMAACLVRSLAVAATLLTAVLCRPQDREPYEDACARATAQEQRGDLTGAAMALAALQGRYPQDYDPALRLCRLRPQRGPGARPPRRGAPLPRRHLPLPLLLHAVGRRDPGAPARGLRAGRPRRPDLRRLAPLRAPL